MYIKVSFESEFNKLMMDLWSIYGKELFNLDGIGEQLDRNKFASEFFNSDDNTANKSVDANSNVSEKNVIVFNREVNKPMSRYNSYFLLWKELRKLYGLEIANRLIENQLTGVYYINDFTSVEMPYCWNYSCYDIALMGLPMVDKIKSDPPKYFLSYLSQVEQFIVIAGNSTLGACMYKDQNIILRKDNKTFSTTAKDFVESVNPTVSFIEEGKEWKTEKVTEDIQVFENNKFVPIKKVFKSPYTEDIYTIKTKTGKQCKVNKKHIFKVLRKGKLLEVEAQGLQIYDTVINTTGGIFPIDKSSQEYKDGQFIGILCGDGYIHHKEGINVSLGVRKEAIMDWMDEYLNIKGYRYFVEDENYWRYHIWDKKIQAQVMSKDITNVYTEDKYPTDIFSKSLEYQIGFIDGLIATDGSLTSGTIELTLINKKLIDIVEQILQNVFVYKTNRNIYKDKRENRKTIYRIAFSKALKDNFQLFNQIKGQDTATYRQETSYFGKASHKKFSHNNYEPIGRCSKAWQASFAEDSNIYDVILSIDVFENDDDFVYEIETGTHWYSCGGILTHNTGIADFLIVASYYVKKILDTGKDSNFVLGDKENIYNYVKELLTKFVYTINQPNRGEQSCFSNLSLFDDPFLDKLCPDYKFTDGSVDKEIIKDLQEIFIDVMNSELKRTPVTFPVTTACFSVDENNEIQDEAFLDVISEKDTEFGFINIYMGDTGTLSSCCRLRSDMTKLNFNTIGGSSSKIGSIGVVTLNLPRLAYNSKDAKEFIRSVSKHAEEVCRINNAKRHILQKRIDLGAMPLYSLGFMDLKSQFSTVGFTGLYEAWEHFNGDHNTNKDDYINFCSQVLDTINDMCNDYSAMLDYPHNMEQTPSENSAIKLVVKDKYLGYEPTVPFYSNQFMPLQKNCNMLDRVYIQGKLDKKCSGGSIAHLNLDSPVSAQKSKELTKFCAKSGVIYYAKNHILNRCEKGHMTVGSIDKCYCGAKIVDKFTRVVGFLTNVSDWHATRQKKDFPNREFY